MRLRIIVKTSHNNPEGHHEGDKYDTFLIYCENSQLYDLLTNSNGYSRSTIVGVEVIKGDGCEVMESQSQPPQPAPVTLVEAVNSLIELVPQIKCVNIYDVEQFGIRVNAVKDALTAERKRQELVDKVIQAARSQLSPDIMDAPCGCPCCEAIAALDAFDKERGV